MMIRYPVKIRRLAQDVVLLALVTSCAHAPKTSETPETLEPTGGIVEIERPLSASLRDNSALFKQTENFDQFAKGKLSESDRKTLIATCRKKSDNPFCWSVSRERTLKEYVALRTRIPPAPTPKQIKPATIQIKNGKVVNWRRIRSADIPEILKGIEGLNEGEFRAVHTRAKQEGCPNNVAIAVAAQLEEELPSHAVIREIAELYEKGGRCRNHDAADRENFLTRAALMYVHRGEYQRARDILVKVKPTDAVSGRPLYWLYQVQKKLGDPAAGKTLQRLLSQHRFAFHALLAQEDEKAGGLQYKELPKIPSRSKRHPQANLLIVQVEALFKYGFYQTAGVIAEWALERFSHLETGIKLYIASMGDAPAQVETGTEIVLFSKDWTTRKTLEIAYPRAYFGAFAGNSSGMNPLLLLSVARKESKFNAKAVSPANARGLLQLTPQTAAKLSGTDTDLLDPVTNVTLGSRYLSELLLRNEGKLHVALACYNAGEEPVARWKTRYVTDDPVLFVDLIPYRETRDYVGLVLSNYYWYKKLYEPDVATASIRSELRAH